MILRACMYVCVCVGSFYASEKGFEEARDREKRKKNER